MGQAELTTRHYAPEEYFALERTSETRHEYYEGEVVAMAGASKQHNLIAQNLATSLRISLRGRGCQSFTESIRVVVQENRHYVYPDVVVTCDPADRHDPYQVRLPVLIAEVLSPGTAEYDRTEKFGRYQKIASLRHYLLLSQVSWTVEWFRRDEAGQWIYTLLNDPAAVLDIPDLSLRLPLADLYEDTDVAPLRPQPRPDPGQPA